MVPLSRILLVMAVLLLTGYGPKTAAGEVINLASSLTLNDGRTEWVAHFEVHSSVSAASLIFEAQRADFTNSDVRMNGESIGRIPVTHQEDPSWVEFQEDVTALLIEGGENSVTVLTGVNDIGTNYDDVNLRNIRVEYQVSPDIQITASWDREFYDCGDPATLSVSVMNGGETGQDVNVDVTMRDPLFGDTISVGSFSAVLGAGASTENVLDVDFPWTRVGTCLVGLEYPTEATVTAVPSGRTARRFIFVAVLPEPVVSRIPADDRQALEDQMIDCSAASVGEACAVTFIEALPVIGITASADAEATRFCVERSYREAGRDGYATAWSIANSVSSVGTSISAASAGLQGTGVGEGLDVAAFVPSALGTLIGCTTALVDVFDPASSRGTVPFLTSGVLADSLAVVLDEDPHELMHVTVVQNGSVTVRRGGATTSVDSIGIAHTFVQPLAGIGGSMMWAGRNPTAFGVSDSNAIAALELNIEVAESAPLGVSTIVAALGSVPVRSYEWVVENAVSGDCAVLSVDIVSEILRLNYDRGCDGAVDVVIPSAGPAVSTPSLPRTAVLHSAVPNPFNPSTTISWTLPRAQNASLEIFDVRGRLIATLFDEQKPAGPGAVEWNGTDATGAKVASGVYLYRLTTDDFEDTKRMVMLK